MWTSLTMGMPIRGSIFWQLSLSLALAFMSPKIRST